MHELAFADAARPTPVVVLKLPLAEYSLGHELLLLRRRNALVILTPAEFSALDFVAQLYAIREAAWICSDTFSARDRFERPARFMFRFRWNEWKRKRWARRLNSLLPEDYSLAAVEFRNYLQESRPHIPTPGPHAIEVLYAEKNDPGRSMGQPMVLSLYHFVISLPMSERPRCAWDFPFSRAMWLYFSHMESLGNYRIENFEEREEQAVMDDAREEGRKRKEREKSEMGDGKSEIARAEIPSGLATAPPDLNAESELGSGIAPADAAGMAAVPGGEL